jgi:hypothetical protein
MKVIIKKSLDLVVDIPEARIKEYFGESKFEQLLKMQRTYIDEYFDAHYENADNKEENNENIEETKEESSEVIEAPKDEDKE